MEFAWTKEQQDAFDSMLRRVRSCSAPRSSCSLTAGELGPHYWSVIWRELGDLGLLGLSVPVRYGGGGLGALDSALRVQAFGQGCVDTGLVFAAAAHLFACAMPVAEFGREDLRRRILPGMCSGDLIGGNAMTEAEAGSDLSRLAVTATEVAGGFVLDGEKSFVTNGPLADVFVTYATTDPDAGYFGITGFVVERTAEGVTVGEPFVKMGLDSAKAAQVRFERCFVPAGQVLGERGQGNAIFQYSMAWERTCLFAGYLGLLDRIQEQCLAHAQSRRQFGRRIGDFQAVSNRLVDMKLRLESARLMLYRACWEMDWGGAPELYVAMSKLSISEVAVANALDAIQIFGGIGYLREHGIETVLRDTVPTRIFSGTSDVQRMIVARGLGL